MVSGEENRDRVAQHYRCVDAAAAAGVQRIVYTSFLGAAATRRSPWVETTGPPRSASARAACVDDAARQLLCRLRPDDGRARTARSAARPATGARRAGRSRRRRRRCGARAARGRSARRRTYGLTGPEALSFNEIAALLSAPAAREVRRRDPRGGLRLTRGLRRARLAGRRLGQHLHRHRQGEAEVVTGDVERVTGHPATSVRELLSRL